MPDARYTEEKGTETKVQNFTKIFFLELLLGEKFDLCRRSFVRTRWLRRFLRPPPAPHQHQCKRWRYLNILHKYYTTMFCQASANSYEYKRNDTQRILPELWHDRLLSLWFPFLGAGKVSESDVTSRENARSRVRVGQCVSAVRAVEMPVCLHRGCYHVCAL